MIGCREAEEEDEGEGEGERKKEKKRQCRRRDHLTIRFFPSEVMKRMTTYESGGDSDDEFIEYVFNMIRY